MMQARTNLSTVLRSLSPRTTLSIITASRNNHLHTSATRDLFHTNPSLPLTPPYEPWTPQPGCPSPLPPPVQRIDVPLEKRDGVEVRVEGNKIAVRLDGVVMRFHKEHLYDHCRCDKCFNKVTKQRMKPLSQIPDGVKVGRICVAGEGVQITWRTTNVEPHESFYPFEFLKKVSYDPPSLSRKPKHEKSLWGPEIGVTKPRIDFTSLFPSTTISEEQAEMGVLEWLKKIDRYGFCMVENVPPTAEASEAAVRRIGLIRETLYGGYYEITSEEKHGDMAYSSGPLPPRTDTTYFTESCGLIAFHILAHPAPGTGGKSLFVDGFHAASELKRHHPEAYATLSRLLVPSHASGNPGYLYQTSDQPVLKHNAATGELIQVRWNNEDRGALGPGWSGRDIAAWYDAARKFEKILDDSAYWVQLKPGTMVMADNWRVLHGRSAFTGQRNMSGAFVGRDDWVSRLEVLRRRFRGGNAEMEGKGVSGIVC